MILSHLRRPELTVFAAVLAAHIAVALWLRDYRPRLELAAVADPIEVVMIEPPALQPLEAEPAPAVPQSKPVVRESPPAAPVLAPPQPPVPAVPPPPAQPAPVAEAPAAPAPPAPAAEAPSPVAAAPSPPAPVEPRVAPPAGPAVAAPTPEPTAPRFDVAYLDNPRPAYPSMARRLGMQGLVQLKVLVTVDGRPDIVELKTSSGSSLLDRTAQDAVKRWRFVPARRGTEPVAAWVVVPINFTLKD